MWDRSPSSSPDQNQSGSATHDEVGGNVEDLRLHAHGVADRQVDLVPAEHVVAGDVECLAERARATEQTDQPDGQVCGVRVRPHRRAVAVDDHRLAALDAVDHRPATRQRRDRFVVRVGRTDDRQRKAALGERGEEHLLRFDLVAHVCVVGVVRERRLAHRTLRQWTVVHRRRRDVHVVAGAVAEQLDALRRVVGAETHEVHHGVEAPVAERRLDARVDR